MRGTKAIGAPPDGTQIELTFVVEGLAEKCHRYAGIFRRQEFEIERAYPAVTADVLRAALSLVDEVFSGQSIALTSNEEVDLVRSDYQRSEGSVPRIRNGKIMPEYGSRGGVVQTLVFERFDERGPWDVAGARMLVEADWEQYEQVVNPDDDEDEEESSEGVSAFTKMLQEVGGAVDLLGEAQTVPHGTEVIYQGRTGKFLRASMSDLTHVPPDRLEKFDATMVSLGFQCIGDSVGDVDQRQEMSRCYSKHPQAIGLLGHRNATNQFGWAEVSDGAVMIDFSEGTNEFHTHFGDGTSLVTTSIDALYSKPEVGIYVRSYAGIPVTKLWEKHLNGIGQFKKHRNTIPIDHTEFVEPVRFMAMMDELFCRFMELK